MAGKGIVINFLANARDFLRGTEDVQDSLDDVADSLDDVSNDGADATENLERGFRDLTRAAEDSSDSVSDVSKKGFDSAGNAAEGFQKRATRQFAATASSFDGSVESIGRMAQSTFGGLAMTIGGGLGFAAATFAAIGGAIVSRWQADADKIKKATKDMYDDMIKSGLDFQSKDYVNKQIGELFSSSERKADLDSVRDAADRLGMSVSDVAVAWVASGEKRDEVNARAKEQLEQVRDKLRELREAAAENPRDAAAGQIIDDYRLQEEALEGVISKMSELDGIQTDASKTANQAREAINTYNDSLSDSQKLAQGLVKDLAKVPPQVATEVHVKYLGDFSEIDRELRQPRPLRVDLVGRNGKRIAW